MSPARTSSNKKTKAKSPKKDKTTPKRLVQKNLSVSQSSGESNDTILDIWKGMKIQKIQIEHCKS